MTTYTAIGSVCWDVVDGDDQPRLGGSVLFASRVAQTAGWDAHVITSGTARLEDALRAAVPGVRVTVQRSADDTVMWFPEAAELGPQVVPTVADPIDGSLVGPVVAASEVVHLAPIMGEITPELVRHVRDAPFVGITPQGLLRHREPGTGRLMRRSDLAAWWSGDVHAAVLSEDELALVAEPDRLDAVALAVTRGPRGCLGRFAGEVVEVEGIELASVSPAGTIGAGDVFAAAFFLGRASGATFADALERANRVAAGHVGGTT